MSARVLTALGLGSLVGVDVRRVAAIRQLVRRRAQHRPVSPAQLAKRWAKAGMPAPDIASVYMRGGVHFDPGFGVGMALATLAAVAVESIEAALSKLVSV